MTIKATANSKDMASKATANRDMASNKVAKVMVSNKVAKVMASKNQITTANSSGVDPANRTRAEVSEAAITSNRAVKPMANNKVVQLMVQANMAKDTARVDSNKQPTASKDMSMLAWPPHVSTFSLTALLLVNKVKVTAAQTAAQTAHRKVTVAS
jgi:hypothetical protein